ncbi:LytTR family DNA-binding domain-containing protein [soil metagenome]
MRGWTDWFGSPPGIARRLAFATVAGVFLGLIGPFGSYDAPASVRIASWTASFWVGSLILSLAIRAAFIAERRTALPVWFTLSAATLVAAAPLSAAAWAIFRITSRRSPSSTALEFYLQTLAITAPLAFGYLALSRLVARAVPDGPSTRDGLAAVETAASSTGTPFLDRLPPRLGRDLLALQMEDHYVRAHTAHGSDLVLIPLRQAVEELSDVEGLRVHRSWWVARSAVAGARWEGRNLRLRLTGGVEAPVARSSVAELRAAGWLPAELATD